MNPPNLPSQQTPSIPRPSRATSWVIAALAVHLLATTMASAATTCTGTFERTRVTRLTHSVAQAIRELVEHSDELPSTIIDHQAEPISGHLLQSADQSLQARSLSPWLLNLPPPQAI